MKARKLITLFMVVAIIAVMAITASAVDYVTNFTLAFNLNVSGETVTSSASAMKQYTGESAEIDITGFPQSNLRFTMYAVCNGNRATTSQTVYHCNSFNMAYYSGYGQAGQIYRVRGVSTGNASGGCSGVFMP